MKEIHCKINSFIITPLIPDKEYYQNLPEDLLLIKL